jgi:hypothetical protein
MPARREIMDVGTYEGFIRTGPEDPPRGPRPEYFHARFRGLTADQVARIRDQAIEATQLVSAPGPVIAREAYEAIATAAETMLIRFYPNMVLVRVASHGRSAWTPSATS